MKKTGKLILSMAIMLCMVLCLFAVTAHAASATYYVDMVNGSDSNDGLTDIMPLKTISAAVTKCTANNGDIIDVIVGGDLPAKVTLNKAGITLTSSTGATLSIADGNTFAFFDVRKDDITIDGIDFIRNEPASSYFINPANCSGTIISDCTFTSTWSYGNDLAPRGIVLTHSATGTKVENCIFVDLAYPIYSNATDVDVSDSTFTDCRTAIAIVAASGDSGIAPIVSGNTFTNNHTDIYIDYVDTDLAIDYAALETANGLPAIIVLRDMTDSVNPVETANQVFLGDPTDAENGGTGKRFDPFTDPSLVLDMLLPGGSVSVTQENLQLLQAAYPEEMREMLETLPLGSELIVTLEADSEDISIYGDDEQTYSFETEPGLKFGIKLDNLDSQDTTGYYLEISDGTDEIGYPLQGDDILNLYIPENPDDLGGVIFVRFSPINLNTMGVGVFNYTVTLYKGDDNTGVEIESATFTINIVEMGAETMVETPDTVEYTQLSGENKTIFINFTNLRAVAGTDYTVTLNNGFSDVFTKVINKDAVTDWREAEYPDIPLVLDADDLDLVEPGTYDMTLTLTSSTDATLEATATFELVITAPESVSVDPETAQHTMFTEPGLRFNIGLNGLSETFADGYYVSLVDEIGDELDSWEISSAQAALINDAGGILPLSFSPTTLNALDPDDGPFSFTIKLYRGADVEGMLVSEDDFEITLNEMGAETIEATSPANTSFIKGTNASLTYDIAFENLKVLGDNETGDSLINYKVEFSGTGLATDFYTIDRNMANYLMKDNNVLPYTIGSAYLNTLSAGTYTVTVKLICDYPAANTEVDSDTFTFKVYESYDITFNPSGGRFADGTTANKIIATDAISGKIPAGNFPAIPTRTGYNFIGWFKTLNIRVTSNTVFTSDTIVTAIWEKQYVIPVVNPNPTSINTPTPTPTTTPAVPDAFTDDNGHWAEKYFNVLSAMGIFNGKGNGLVGPNDVLTREQLVVLFANGLATQAELDSAPFASFKDVDQTAYYAKALNWAYAKGIIKGHSAERFGVGDTLTREQLALIISRLSVYLQITLPAPDVSAYADDSNVSDWAKTGVYALKGAKYMEGKPGNMFDPQGTALRGEAAKILYLLLLDAGKVPEKLKI